VLGHDTPKGSPDTGVGRLGPDSPIAGSYLGSQDQSKLGWEIGLSIAPI
jgi:hypothetical protein